ncbi:MAG TPA: hypothetical protein VNK03_00955 [Gammaproteobacteria bacterium]|nr:hypothetical protein [Gammaproteobacteria bacterium]
MKINDRVYLEQYFGQNFDAQVAANAVLAASKGVCTGTLGKTLDEALRNLVAPNVEITLPDIRAEFLRRITALKDTGTLSEAVFVAAKDAVTKAIEDCDPGLLMFKKGVRHFCSDASVATAGTPLFLITARNAIIRNEAVSRLVQQGLERRSVEGRELFDSFVRKFQTLSDAEIVAAENALNAFDNHRRPPASDAMMRELSELGVDEKSHYIETPQYLFGCKFGQLTAFLNREIAARRRMIELAGAGQSTGQADRSVCTSVMNLATRYIVQNDPNTPNTPHTPNAPKALQEAERTRGRELQYREKIAVLDPIIDAWERNNAALFDTTIQQIRKYIDSVAATALQNIADKSRPLKDNSILESVIIKSKKVTALQNIVDKSRPLQPRGWSAVLSTPQWVECVSNLSPALKIEFTQLNLATINLAFKRVSNTVVTLAEGDDIHQAISIRNGRVALNGLNNTVISTVVLVWKAVHDRKTVIGAKGKVLADSAENAAEIDRIIQQKEMNFVQALWEFQTEYGAGKACGHGSYNKIVESLNLTDPDVRVGNDVDTNFEQILAILDEKFVKELVLTTAEAFDKEALSSAWDSKTPSIGERALIDTFKAVLHEKLIAQLPTVLATEFSDFHRALQYQQGALENFVLQMLIPAIEKNIDQHPVTDAPPAEAQPLAEAWVRPFIEEETYDQALRLQNPNLSAARKNENALKAVFKNQIARRLERVLLTSGMPVHRTKEDSDDFDDDASCYANSWAGELAASAQDEKFNAEQAITALVDKYKRTYVGNLPADSTKLITSLVTAFSSAEQRVQKRHSLRSRDVTGFLEGPDAQRLENVGTAKPYEALHVPLLPSVFPYNPTDDQRKNFGLPSFSVAATIQQPLEDQIPSGVLEQLSANGMSVANLEMFFCVQNMPWNNSAFLLRPHPWLKPDAQTNQANYNHSSNIQASISDIGVRFPQLGAIDKVRVHAARAGNVVYSGEPQFAIEGAQDFNNTHCFYSLCVDGATNPKRAALTLHWLLNDADHKRISALLQNTPTLEAFSKKVEALGQAFTLNTPINGISPVTALNAMLQGGQPQAQPSANQKYRLFGQPANQFAPVAAVVGGREEKLSAEASAARNAQQLGEARRAVQGIVPVAFHFNALAARPEGKIADEAAAQRQRELQNAFVRARDERAREEAAAARAQLEVQQAAERRRQAALQEEAARRVLQEAEARRAEAARVEANARAAAAPPPARGRDFG